MVVMEAGRVLQVGTPQEIYYQPGSQFVAEFMVRSNFLEGVVTHVDGEMCRVRTPSSLDVDARFQPGLTAGSKVVVQMRAEHLQLHYDCPATGNSLPGRVQRRIFLGNRTEYQIMLTTGEELVVVGAPGSPLMPNEEVWVTAKPADCVVLRAGAAA
jgi:ABC-type Fe3+/spermidine/putrescine transport system ATPase subunit